MKIVDEVKTPKFTAYHADTVDVARTLPDRSVDLSVYSPPFSSLYTYTSLPNDMGNSRGHEQFFGHLEFLIAEQRRVMKPGRLVVQHVMQLPTSKERDGYIGLVDFRGDVIRAYQRHGFIYHSEVCIWKNPVTAMQRTKALGLLHKTIRKDAAMSRQGIADYLIVMRTPGGNDEPIANTRDAFPVEMWQRYASPVWVTTSGVDAEGFAIPVDVRGEDSAGDGSIDYTNTLQARSAREHADERHLAPLQLGIIRRVVRLWSNPGDVVWSPFMGIGSEGYVALEMGRRFVGAEIKGSYFAAAVANLRSVEHGGPQASLFGEAVGS